MSDGVHDRVGRWLMGATIEAGPRASVTVRYEQVLPEVCVRCGESACAHVEYAFFEPASETRENAVNLGNVLVGLLSMAATIAGAGAHHPGHTQAMGPRHVVKLPFCASHQSMRTAIEFRQTMAAVAVLVAIPNAPKAEPRPLAAALIFGGLGVVWVASVIRHGFRDFDVANRIAVELQGGGPRSP